MKLKKISFKNYKAFKDKQELILKPITLLIGKNSSGKSAVSRLPLLLGKSLSTASSSPIELEFDGLEFGGAFKDLVHNRIDHGNISFGLLFELDGKEVELEVTVQNIADSPIQFISKYEIRYANFNLSMRSKIDFDTEGFPWKYKVEGSINGVYNVGFKGLLVEYIEGLDDPESNKVISTVNAAIRNNFSNIDYIGPFRAQPERDYIFKGNKPKNTGYWGELAPHILGIDSFFDKKIIKAVGKWYEENLGGWKLEIETVGSKFQVVLVSPDDQNVKVNLKDVGHGMSQVLPFIVRSHLHSSRNGLMIIEQPELHLHPAAHGGLAALIVNSILEEQSSWIIETHSEIFILRIRRLIAEGKLRPEDVIIYLVEDEKRPGSSLTEITIDKDGEVSDWPAGVFSEDYDELMAIRSAQND